MKKFVCLLLSVCVPLALTSPVFAATSSLPINGHPDMFGHHAITGSVAGATSTASENWSGYAVTGNNGAFTSVSSSWVQPTLNCSALPKSAYSAYWVGLDGFTSQTVEQIGTEGDCVRNHPTYTAWYEMYPGNPYEVSVRLTITPGNAMNAGVTYTPPTTTTTVVRGKVRTVTTSASYTLTLANNSTGKSFQTTITPRQTYARSSAEVITEAPYSNGILPLADFGTASYTDALVDGQPMGAQPSLQNIIMENPAGMIATPSAFDATNKNFAVVWSE